VTDFHSLYSHGFARVALATPRVRVADPSANAERILALARQASERGAVLVAFPELAVSSYTADDLFHQDALNRAVEEGLRSLVEGSSDLNCALVVGAPVRTEGILFNCAVVIHGGRVVGVVPKSYLPSYREFYEERQFGAARDASRPEVRLLGAAVPFGPDLLFQAAGIEGLIFHVEVCEDLWVPIPPSSLAALGGATVLINVSASNALVAKSEYRRQLCASQSARCLAAYLYTAAGEGESTTDLAWDGQAMVYENGDRLAESTRFAAEEQLVTADVDLTRLGADRLRFTSFHDARRDHLAQVAALRTVQLPLAAPASPVALERQIARYPYVPADPAKRSQRCAEVHQIQVQGLATRLRATGLRKLVIGVSGGLDSTAALAVAVKCMDRLGWPRTNILAYTMPGFATSQRTRENAHHLMAALGVSAAEIDIRPSCLQLLRDLGHPAARGEAVYDTTFENVQAGERTSHLFRLANQHQALVVGTGDLSELALGWCTYGVGDQMSHYSVNASVPKTLIRHLVGWMAETDSLGADTSDALRAILATEISPELVPSGDGQTELPAQRSEAVVGPYELQDFHLYYLLRYGYLPSRVAFLAHHAWHDPTLGDWPDAGGNTDGTSYDLAEIKRWLRVFLERFIATSQFKRSALPNGPKVGSGGSLSPRGDWRAPSDASARAWLDELEANVPE
jgi:NAD+ synthase (glutamine-hydrolysing)